MNELVFEVLQESGGGYCAEGRTESLFTQADTWEELRRNAVEAVNAFFFDGGGPPSVRLRLVRDEVFRGVWAFGRATRAGVVQYVRVGQVGSHLIVDTAGGCASLRLRFVAVALH